MGEKNSIQTILEFIKAIDELTKSYHELKNEVSILSNELKHQKNLLNSIIESISEGVIAVDNEYNVILLNSFAKKLMLEQPELDLKELQDHKEIKLNSKNIKVNVYPLKMQEKDIGKVIVLRDITREKELEEESKRKEKLSAMGEIAVTLAHEIRNPLGSIELFAGILRRNIQNEEDKKIAEAIISVVRSINKTISNILLFTKSIEPVKEKLLIKEIIDTSIEQLRYLINQKKVIVVTDGKEDDCIYGDFELLKVCFVNLITNAIEAVKEGGRVQITWIEKGNESEVSVTDYGPGIPEDIINDIFNPFFTTKKGGTGIGLAIIQRIVEAHKGLIKVKSKPGETVFTVILPHPDKSFER